MTSDPTSTPSCEPSGKQRRYWRWGKDSLLLGVGYMLSPLSWWNDLFFNLPIAYGFGYLVRWAAPEWFIPATVVGYWLSNVLGIVMMQFAATDLMFARRSAHLRRDILIGVGSSTAYTVLVIALIYFHVLELPTFLTTDVAGSGIF